tara:strand:+ start:209 stop:469 length:261 start_codon:yes stop_codon:yes gene_type:complete
MDRSHQYFDSAGELVSTTYRDVTWETLRSMRDDELQNADWRFMSDQSPSDEWVDYRAFLRDLPQNHPGDNANDACDAWNAYEKPEE